MKNKPDNNKKEKIDRRQFLKKVTNTTKYIAVAAVTSEIVELSPTLKKQRPDLLPGGEGDYAGV